ncbi:serine protease [Shimia marina]|uniref:His-Xaa-Ser repeat protein HxsA n=1 Tax=Shimia marina TaxID=321267 RepID=A0A0P1EQ50_9RHOB|nr:serine protease [Shimia marina]CUH52535.1 His-Xaa-Ser repeat protein HxsA [Shimia marina]SFE49283.1 Putative peptidoglycan binding domain-containing protein [Shimia marina]
MLRTLLSLFATILLSATLASAQSTRDDIVWVQLEARPSLTEATENIRNYAQRMSDVNGFSLGGGWYAVALGPYRREDAENVLRVYRSEGLVPIDSYLATAREYRSQFWPVGANQLANPEAALNGTSPSEATASQPLETAPDDTEVVIVETPEQPATLTPPISQPDETVREARASEARLTRSEKMQLQEWLKWAGYYNASIDGAFGRGTRGSMSAWQADNGFDPTGVLTTLQRATLRGQYYAVLEGLDLQRVTDTQAGIEMVVPLGVVAKSATEYPFVRYEANGDVPAQVMLISQAGDQNTLFGLYDIMQTLEIVPLTGPRERKKNSFVLTGEDRRIISHTEVTLKNDQIKGFTLIWPAGDEERRTRVLREMQASFTSVGGTLDPAAGAEATQDIDLISGLQVRKPQRARSGFFIDTKGHVVTSAEAVRACTQVTIEGEYEATVAVIDEALGVAILSPKTSLAPMATAALRSGAPRLQSDVAVAGYSFEGALGAPTVTFGTLSDVKGLRGEQELARLAMRVEPGDWGGPVFDAGGAVFGMLLPRDAQSTQQLPTEVNFAVNADALRALLAQEGIQAAQASTSDAIAPEDLTTQAGNMTVLVSCW